MMNEPKTRQLAATLTDDDVRHKGERIVELLGELDVAEADLADARGNYKAAAAAIREEVAKLAREVRSRSELRDVAIVENHDHRRGVVEVVRLDTSEVVSVREMTPEERQTPLPFIASPGLDDALAGN